MKYIIGLFCVAFIIALGCQDSAVEPINDEEAAIALIESELNSFDQDNDDELDDYDKNGRHDKKDHGHKKRKFKAHLKGKEEVPARATHAKGLAKFKMTKDRTSIHFKLIVAKISNVVGAHIHRGGKGQNGPIVFGLYSAAPGGGRINGRISEGDFTPADLTGPYAGSTNFDLFLEDLHDDSLYVNVHTDDGVDPPNTGKGDFPGGEIRGKLK